MFTMYGDYSHMMWLLHNIKTMQIYKFTHNPVLLYLFTNLTECQGGLLLRGMINNIKHMEGMVVQRINGPS